MPVPQITLFLLSSDKAKTPKILAEVPGRNGVREKIDLGSDFALRNPEIVAALKTQAAREAAIQVEIDRTKALTKREDAILTRERRIEVEKAAHLAKWNAYLDTLSPSARAFKEAEVTEKLTKAQEAAANRKRQLWLHTAKDHTVELANRVIPDLSERPSRTFKISGTPGSFSPRTFTGDTTRPTYLKKPGSGSVNSKVKSGRAIPSLKITI